MQPAQPSGGVGTRWLFNDEEHTPVWTKWHDLGADQRRRRCVPTEQRGHPNLQGRSTLREPAAFGEPPPQFHEVVEGLLHRIADEVVDDVTDLFESPAPAMRLLM